MAVTFRRIRAAFLLLPARFCQHGRVSRGNLDVHSKISDGILDPVEFCRRNRRQRPCPGLKEGTVEFRNAVLDVALTGNTAFAVSAANMRRK